MPPQRAAVVAKFRAQVVAACATTPGDLAVESGCRSFGETLAKSG